MSERQDAGGSCDPLVPLILRSVDAALETTLAKELQSSEARTQLDIVRSLLYWSVARIEQGAVLQADRARALAAAVGAPGAALPTRADDVTLAAVVAAETEFYGGLDPESVYDPATAYLGGKSLGRPSFAAAEPPVDAEAITAYLRRRFPEHPQAAASDVVALTGGMSKDTILFELTGAGAFDGGVVLRKDLAQRGSDYSSIDEYPLIRAAYDAGLPLAEPLWSEPDEAGLGTAFVASRRVAGGLAAGQRFDDEQVRRHFCDRLASTLARIHALSLADLGIYGERASLSVSELLERQVEEWRDFWRRSQLSPDVAMDFLFDWMAANLPPEPGYAAAVVHGDYGFHNLMTGHGEVTAILDWEFSHPGDPLEDVAYTRQFVAPLGLWEQFLADYQRHGGVPWDDARGRYFAIWQNVRNACLCAGALNAFSRGRPGNLRMASAGLGYLPRFKLAALRQIGEVAVE